MTFKENRRKSSGLIWIIFIVAILVGVAYVYLSPVFEQNKPIVTVKDRIFWNLKNQLKINLSDESGIKYYKVTFKDGQRDIVLEQRVLSDVKKELEVLVKPPKLDIFYKGNTGVLEIEVVDNSKWNFLEGNKVVKRTDIILDTKKPVANILANSRYIQRGGSAVVVANVSDKNIKDMYITFNNKKRFELLPYKKEGFFVSLVAWPMDIEEFERVNLIVTDKANNITISKIPFYIQSKKVKEDHIKLTKRFISNVSANVLEQSFEEVPSKLEDIFVYSNTNLRKKNVEMIDKVAKKVLDKENFATLDVKAFKRLRGSKTVANYGEKRHYYLEGQKINEAWHLGIDWASVKKATVRTTNSGEVIFKDYLGLYGNTIIIDHGMGLNTLYAHTSSQKVKLGDKVKAGQKIANTGATGAVFGDHLHFGVLVQGVEVNPIEWMDSNWIKVRITNILKDANKQIDGM